MPYANPHLLWTVDELKTRLDDPRLVLMDMRQPEAFSNGHIPGSRSFDIFGISLIDTSPAPLRAFLWIIEHLLQFKGVNDDSIVVVYDDISGMRSARLFWLLELFGHPAVHMLSGGHNAWVSAGLPLTQSAAIPSAGNFKIKLRPELLATADDVLSSLGVAGSVIVDTRSEGEHTGKVVRAARGGSIPGAVHLEWTNNLDAAGSFKPAEELSAMYEALGVTKEKTVIPHCQGAYRSAHTYLALRLIGYPDVRNYIGSWGEWGNRPDLPIEIPSKS